ncbi:MAG TPA: hypothetical protein VGU25_12010 [Acidobacteriaceae bacterium]|nr:hypothetical protein [Acidobacteriaceae bacterium]
MTATLQQLVGIQVGNLTATTNNGSANIGMEKSGSMQKSVSGLHLVHVSRNLRRTELREATTGRPIAVPRIMAVAETVQPPVEKPPVAPTVELAFYRKYTEALLRRYLRVSMEVGRVPSVMGRELFRGNVSHYKAEGFEDAVILCVDIERCLAKLTEWHLRLVKRIAMQGYTLQEAAPLLGLDFRRCHEQYGVALDELTRHFLAGRILEPLKSCQDVETV